MLLFAVSADTYGFFQKAAVRNNQVFIRFHEIINFVIQVFGFLCTSIPMVKPVGDIVFPN